ncbi:protein translocase SEC61 complex subunit gamma [Candidatus Pacearchaeota archaeon]|nr:protein translocase SEC61 complex subunit gamma [Candidatus Pacearchaeota archaeon]
MNLKEKFSGLSSFFVQCRRVWTLLRKPSRDEFKSISKISGIGILLLGLLGFIIALVLGVFK